MKLSHFAGKLAVIAFVVVATHLNAQSTTQGSAKIVKVSGAARYSLGNNVWLPLSEGMTLKAGAVIQTASESSVDLVFGDENAGDGQDAFRADDSIGDSRQGRHHRQLYRRRGGAENCPDAERTRAKTIIAHHETKEHDQSVVRCHAHAL